MARVGMSLIASAVTVTMLAVLTTAALPQPCSADPARTAAPTAAEAAPAPRTAPALPADTASRVVAAVRGVSPGARVGLLVWDIGSGTTLASSGAGTRYQSASLVKLLVGIQALREGVPRERISRMLRESDDAVASALWGELGSDALPGSVARGLGISGVGGPDIPGRWGNVLLSAEDLLAVYRHLLTRAPSLISPLRDAPRRAADGFDQHFGIPSAFAGPWSVKQAWGTSARATTAHTTGLLGEATLVLLLTSHPPGTGFRQATSAATAGATALAGVL
ncbi:hypothetical protein ACFPM7_18210 [Actinokineospora guangxiensis]|uniref:Beta-lactamase class A n=1 Tax=Actinokineospora guangxiensis TaxID=1490288 RepID=A0ABW0ES37_9PSEU